MVRPQFNPSGLEDVKPPKFVRRWNRWVGWKGAAGAVAHLGPLGQVFFPRLMPFGRLPSYADEQAPLGVTRVEDDAGRLIGHRRRAQTGVRGHGRRIADLPRAG